jgi:hypothetical protein
MVLEINTSLIKKDMTVMQVRPSYSIVYQFKPILRLRKEQVHTKSDFVKFIKDLTTNWKDGDYFFRSQFGTFCYFTLNGKRVNLLKKSKITGKEYLCWEIFNPPVSKKTSVTKTVKKVVAKKTVTKKVTVKKTTVKKVASKK